MNKDNIPVITDREELYDKCENMEQLFDKYYLPLLDKHYSKTYELQQENKQLKEEKEELKKWLEGFFQGKTINDIPVDDYYKKGMYRMIEYTLDKIKELEEGVK